MRTAVVELARALAVPPVRTIVLDRPPEPVRPA